MTLNSGSFRSGFSILEKPQKEWNNSRVFPAFDLIRSGTRKEELIYHPEELQRIYGLRRAMQGLGPIESMEMLISRLKKTKSNAEFLLSLARQ